MSAGTTLTWLGHSTFRIGTPEGKHLLIDPWLAGNPMCPQAFHHAASDAILVTHGHFDHVADVKTAFDHCSGPVVGTFELTMWLASRGLPEARLIGMNKGGTMELDTAGVAVTMTDARHSSSTDDGTGKPLFLGEPAGYVLRFSNGEKIYVAGDTCLFGDMQWIGTLWSPQTAILPIGDFYTMDPLAAAHACKLLGVQTVVPCHFGTFPALRGTPAQLREAIQALGLKTQVRALEIGATTRLGTVG